MGKPLIDLTGRTFGRLRVIGLSKERTRGGAKWTCECSCGTVDDYLSANLRGGSTRSCGCLRREMVIEMNTTHGHTTGGRSPEYTVYRGMLTRCYNPRDEYYDDYGGRGIGVCERWRNSFEAFLEDMGPRPTQQHKIERLENDRGYGPENCVWATDVQQARNRRSNFVVEFSGKSQCLMSWCEELNLSYYTVRDRLRVLHWSVERAFATPTPKPYEPLSKAAKPTTVKRLTITPSTPSP